MSAGSRQIHMIATVGRHGQIGLAGTIPWQSAADLDWFKETTIGSAVIIGRQDLQTMPTLIGRDILAFDDAMTPESLIRQAMSGPYHNQPIFVAGGAHVFRLFAPFVNGLRLINHVSYDGNADAWFPFDAYEIAHSSGHPA